MNGKILEDIVDKRLRGVKFKDKRFYNTIAENVEFYIKGCRYEEDNFALRINHKQDKKYVVVVEDKLSYKRVKKAHQQLRRDYLKIRSEDSNVRIFLLFAHSYNKGKYVIDWYKPSKGILKQDNIKYFKGKVQL